jgi:hypothetical protein
MILNALRISAREQQILAGLYLAKYDSTGIKKLGFHTFTEAFNVIGYSMGARPASIKNYRDEFDSLFPNPRKGWHNRPVRKYCLKVLEDYEELDLEAFAGLIRSFVGLNENVQSEDDEQGNENDSWFAKRLITGLAAEQYFEKIQPKIPEFKDYSSENMTRLGCGYDFRLKLERDDKEFLAIEVKGLRQSGGTISMTPKEHRVAGQLKGRFFLFVVKNFQESPTHEIFSNPLSTRLQFARIERPSVQVSWLANI